jgi:hypothetical protein
MIVPPGRRVSFIDPEIRAPPALGAIEKSENFLLKVIDLTLDGVRARSSTIRSLLLLEQVRFPKTTITTPECAE